MISSASSVIHKRLQWTAPITSHQVKSGSNEATSQQTAGHSWPYCWHTVLEASNTVEPHEQPAVSGAGSSPNTPAIAQICKMVTAWLWVGGETGQACLLLSTPED